MITRSALIVSFFLVSLVFVGGRLPALAAPPHDHSELTQLLWQSTDKPGREARLQRAEELLEIQFQSDSEIMEFVRSFSPERLMELGGLEARLLLLKIGFSERALAESYEKSFWLPTLLELLLPASVRRSLQISAPQNMAASSLLIFTAYVMLPPPLMLPDLRPLFSPENFQIFQYSTWGVLSLSLGAYMLWLPHRTDGIRRDLNRFYASSSLPATDQPINQDPLIALLRACHSPMDER